MKTDGACGTAIRIIAIVITIIITVSVVIIITISVVIIVIIVTHALHAGLDNEVEALLRPHRDDEGVSDGRGLVRRQSHRESAQQGAEHDLGLHHGQVLPDAVALAQGEGHVRPRVLGASTALQMR